MTCKNKFLTLRFSIALCSWHCPVTAIANKTLCVKSKVRCGPPKHTRWTAPLASFLAKISQQAGGLLLMGWWMKGKLLYILVEFWHWNSKVHASHLGYIVRTVSMRFTLPQAYDFTYSVNLETLHLLCTYLCRLLVEKNVNASLFVYRAYGDFISNDLAWSFAPAIPYTRHPSVLLWYNIVTMLQMSRSVTV